MNDLTENENEEFKLTAEQQLAIDHKDSDILISAGAGSGKTSTLTDRIVYRICDEKLKKDISKMLVVTYTKAAASELKTRICKKLLKELQKDPQNKHIANQMIKVPSADICTIDSFCYKCIKPHFDKLGLDSGFKIGEKNELEALMLQAMDEVIDSFYEGDKIDPDFLLVSDCYSKYTEDTQLNLSLLNLYEKLSNCPDGLKLLLKPIIDTDDIMSSRYAKALVRHLERIVNHFKPLTRAWYDEIMLDPVNNKKYIGVFGELCTVLDDLELSLSCPKYDTLARIFNKYPQCKLPGGRSSAVPTVDTERIKAFRYELDAVLKNLKQSYFYADKAAINSVIKRNEKMCLATYNVLMAFDKSFQEKKRRLGICDFKDLEKLTLKLLYEENGHPSEIANELKEKYDELYIDEYQDVNGIQDKIFKAFEKNNRFMVGDIKQSIYCFRSAEPDLFSHYRDSFVPYIDGKEKVPKFTPRSLFMSDNFRCDPDVIKLANHVSDYMFFNSRGFSYVAEDRLKQSKKLKVSKARLKEAKRLLAEGKFKSDKEYKDYIAYKPQCCELHIINKKEFTEDTFPPELDPQAEYVAQRIKELLNNGELSNRDKVEPKHIAILLKKASGAIDKYIDALNRYGIKNEYIQDVSFFEKPHILLLRSILNAIDNPTRDEFLAGAMHSHIFKFTLEELIRIKKHSPNEYCLYSALKCYDIDDSIRAKIQDFLENLDTCRNEIRKMSADEAISHIISKTHFVSYCNKEERQDIIKLYNMACDYERGSYKGLFSFLSHINENAEKDITETVTKDPQNSVRIMTMHKSKGLEFEICFLCDTEKSYFGNNRKPDIYYNRHLGICGYVSRDGGIVKYDNLLRSLADLTKKEEEKEEAMRVLYVAMTRAKSKLYIVASELDGGTARLKARDENTFDPYTNYECKSHFQAIFSACNKDLDFLKVVDNITPDQILDRKASESATKKPSKKKVAKIKKKLLSRFDLNYEHEHLEKIPSKLSVSTLHPAVLDDEEGGYYKSSNLDSLPTFELEKKKRITSADIGTATHVFLQFCDFEKLSKNGVECELNRLEEEKFISKEIKALVNKNDVETFLNSDLLKELLAAKEVIREFRFNVLLPAIDFTKEKDPRFEKENLLVQGVTDCIYETQEGELILVDYKTDNVTLKNYENVLKERHSSQLFYYKLACRELFGRDVSKAYIYSVPLGITLEI